MQTDWKTAREQSERHPCPYMAPRRQPRQRGDAPDHSLACGAQPGETCRDPRTNRELMGQPAHLVRQRLAGVDAPARSSAAYVT